VPAVFAIAESTGNVNGKDFIAALAVGCDIVCRLGLAFNENPGEYGWYMPPILGSFGAAAAAGKLLNLDEKRILDAFSLSLCQSTCSAELRYSPHSDIRSVRDAFAAQAGVMAARLAQKGVQGFDQPFEGKAGLFNLYSKGNYDRLRLVEDLGTKFEGANISFKPWPACRGTHTYIEAALHILKEHAPDPDDIADIRVIVSSFNRMLCEPENVKKAPQTVIDAKFSIPFTVATALYYKEVGLAHFTPERLKDQNVLQLAQKIRYELDPGLGLRDATRGFLEIKTKGNKTYAKRIDQAYGHPDSPISQKGLVAKFMSCADRARTKIPQRKLKKAAKSILALEKSKDIRQILALL
jgi:2-methylcitrate dehydratase PrpD